MVSIVEYKDYLQQQYQKIERKVLADESVGVLRQLENKQHLYRRLAEIFEKTFNSERQNLIDRLIKENNRLKEKQQTQTDRSMSQIGSMQDIRFQPQLHKAVEQASLERAKLLKKNEQLLRQIEEMGKREAIASNNLKKQLEEWRNRFESEAKKAAEKEALLKTGQHQVRDSLLKMRQQNLDLTRQLENSQEAVNRIKLQLTNLKAENDLLRSKLSRMQGQNRSFFDEINDVQAKLGRVQAASSRKDKQLQHLQQTNNHLNQKLALLQQRLLQGQQQTKVSQHIHQGNLNIEQRRMQLQLQRLEQELRKVKKQHQRTKLQLADYRKLYEQSLFNLQQTRTPIRLENEVRMLKQQLADTVQNNYDSLDNETTKLRKQHIEDIEAINKEKAKEIEKIKRKFELKLKEKEVEAQQLSKDLKKHEIQAIQMRNHLTQTKKQLQHLKQDRKSSGHKDHTTISHLKKIIQTLQHRIEQQRNTQQQQRKATQSLIQQNNRLTRLNRHLQHTNLGDQVVKTAQLQSKRQSTIRQLKQSLHSKTTQLNNAQCRIDSMELENQYLKQQNIELSDKIEQYRLKYSLVEQSLENKQKQLILVEISNKNKIEEIIKKQQNQIEQLRQFYIEQLKAKSPQQQSVDSTFESQQLDNLLKNNKEIRRQLQEKSILLRRSEQITIQLQQQIENMKDKQHKCQKQYDNSISLSRQQLKKSLNLLMDYQQRASQYRIKFMEFKKQLWFVVKNILNSFKQQLSSLKQQLRVHRYQSNKQASEAATTIQSRILRYCQDVSSTFLLKDRQRKQQLQERLQQQARTLKMQHEQKMSQQILQHITLNTQKQLQLKEVKNKLSIIQQQLQQTSTQHHKYQIKNKQLERQLEDQKNLNGRLQRKSRQLSLDLTSVKEVEKRQRIQLDKEVERVKKLQKNCQQRIQAEQKRYAQDNFDMFQRCQKQLQKVIQQQPTSYKKMLPEDWSTQTPTINRSSQDLLQSLKDEIVLQRQKLQKLEQPVRIKRKTRQS